MMGFTGFTLTRQLAYAMAHDAAMRSMSEHEQKPWTNAAQEVYARTFREVWSLDDEFTQQRFEVKHGRAPHPYSEADYQECRAIYAEMMRERGGVRWGLAPAEDIMPEARS